MSESVEQVGINGIFNTGKDLLTNVMGTYFEFENNKAGLELAQAEAQQARLQEAVNVDQQINQALYESQGRGFEIGNKEVIGGGIFVALIIAAVVIAKT